MGRRELFQTGSETSHPKIKELESCDFTITESDVEGYSVLVLPEVLQQYFDEGYDAVRIYSTEIAALLPALGGKTAAKHSLAPHQDHPPTDRKRFLALSRTEDAPRGSSTYFTYPETVASVLPDIRSFFEKHRNELKELFQYDPASQVSEEELLSCFEDGGIDKLVENKVGPNASDENKLFAYCGILGYLIQGDYADQIVADFLAKKQGEVIEETWERGGVLIIDNSKVFHGRFGGNENPIQRNWFVAHS